MGPVHQRSWLWSMGAVLVTTGSWFGKAGCDRGILVRICSPNRNLILSVSKELGLLIVVVTVSI